MWPYVKFENTEEWKQIESGLKKLIKNGDLALQTKSELVIGYLVSCLSAKKETPSLPKEYLPFLTDFSKAQNYCTFY